MSLSPGDWRPRSSSRARAHADASYFEKMDRFKTIKLLVADDFMTGRYAVELTVLEASDRGVRVMLVGGDSPCMAGELFNMRPGERLILGGKSGSGY